MINYSECTETTTPLTLSLWVLGTTVVFKRRILLEEAQDPLGPEAHLLEPETEANGAWRFTEREPRVLRVDGGLGRGAGIQRMNIVSSQEGLAPALGDDCPSSALGCSGFLSGWTRYSSRCHSFHRPPCDQEEF